MKNKPNESKINVLKKNIDDAEARELVENKKTNVFRSMLKKPKPEEVHLDSLKLNYESIMIVSGTYSADFFQKAIYPIKVNYNVKEIVLGEGIFPIKTKSKFLQALSSKKGKNTVELNLEEHIYINDEDTIYFDHHGQEIKFPFKLDSKLLENYPSRILATNVANVKKPEITKEFAIQKLSDKLKKPIHTEVRDLKDLVTITDISEVYVPIYEARLIGPKKKVEILRIDAVRKKIL